MPPKTEFLIRVYTAKFSSLFTIADIPSAVKLFGVFIIFTLQYIVREVNNPDLRKAMRISVQKWRQSKNLTLVVVTVAMILDTVLFSVVMPMLPDYLKRLHESEAAANEDAASKQSFVLNSPGPLRQESAEIFHSPGVQNTAGESSGDLRIEIGVLTASKMVFELISSPIFGKLSDRFGCTVIMFVGFFVTFLSTLIFAFAESYGALFVARSFQGVGTAAVQGPGLGLIADKFHDTNERAQAISTCYGGLIFGLIIGPAFGGIMYQLYGKTLPFLILAAVILVDGCLRAFIAESEQAQRDKGPSIKELLTDPYIFITLGAIFFLNFAYTTMEPQLLVWMMETMDANSAQQGLAILPILLTLLLSLNFLNRLSTRVEKYLMAMLGLLLLGVSLSLMPLAKTQIQLILPSAFLGLGCGMVECALLPHLGYLVDLRHESVYGTVYSLTQSAYCSSAIIGAPLGGILVANIGFQWTFTCVGIVCIIYAPLLFCIRNPSKNEEKPPEVSSDQNASTTM